MFSAANKEFWVGRWFSSVARKLKAGGLGRSNPPVGVIEPPRKFFDIQEALDSLNTTWNEDSGEQKDFNPIIIVSTFESQIIESLRWCFEIW